ncbi:MAG: hypothetical protein DCF18_06355 [Cyanobium sp.]|uniref:FkbM family methyltransferase n=1 Tax=Synechococcus sp. CS-1333 TaxID=2848638 RepID=UPI000DBC0FC5|nr:FkbM family methyltransferase [Synechococcus sp. CS-1333]MCT0209777.1 FkbM family methyltransferase [Synechococcus sp. CS-1333]PZV23436.1 MAG: hypothetical protein DCF18_06355 [Cyanobium sp.]
MTTAYHSSITQALFTDFLESRKFQCSVLQIGANDGVNADFISPRAIKNNWYCVFVEPHPLYFQQLKQHYSACTRCFFENAAIGLESDGTKDLYYVKDVHEGNQKLKGIASFQLSHLLGHGIREDNIDREPVSVVTLQSIVDKYYLFDVDILVVDTEGWEPQVFQSVSFDRFLPKLIIFEHCHLSDEKFKTILSHVGSSYDACKAEFDTFMIRRRF